MEVNGISTLNPLAPTIDHIIPLEKGGSPTDLGNLQLAHWKCNNAKRTKLIIQPKPIENDAPMDWEAILLSP
jgi:5-methylcytosine-specific restriction endonuclease McrA